MMIACNNDFDDISSNSSSVTLRNETLTKLACIATRKEI